MWSISINYNWKGENLQQQKFHCIKINYIFLFLNIVIFHVEKKVYFHVDVDDAWKQRLDKI